MCADELCNFGNSNKAARMFQFNFIHVYYVAAEMCDE